MSLTWTLHLRLYIGGREICFIAYIDGIDMFYSINIGAVII